VVANVGNFTISACAMESTADRSCSSTASSCGKFGIVRVRLLYAQFATRIFTVATDVFILSANTCNT
jgi:hypothetical protein